MDTLVVNKLLDFEIYEKKKHLLQMQTNLQLNIKIIIAKKKERSYHVKNGRK